MNILYLIKKSKKENIWTLGNKALYDLCKKYPKHDNEKEIIAKIWLIGRSYAASIERRKTHDNYINDDYYIKNVIPKIKKSKIDIKINSLNKNDYDSILDCHFYLTNLFKIISGLEKRSLSSKYLHFHFPDIFYIYDSRAVNSLSKLLKFFKIKNINSINYKNKYDPNYTDFFIKSRHLVKFISKKFNIYLNCREFDNLLIAIGNMKLRGRNSTPTSENSL